MATAPAIDFDATRRQLESELTQVESDLGRETHARIMGEGNPVESERLRSRANTLRQELAELDGAKSYDADARAKTAAAERLDRRGEDARAFDACLTGAIDTAKMIGDHLPLSEIGPAVAKLRAQLHEAFSLVAHWVDNRSDVRKQNRLENLRTVLGTRAIDDWLEATAHRAGLVRGAAPVLSAELLGRSLGELVEVRMAAARNHARQEFPELGDD